LEEYGEVEYNLKFYQKSKDGEEIKGEGGNKTTY